MQGGLLSVGSAALSAVAEDPLNNTGLTQAPDGPRQGRCEALELPYDFSPDSGDVLKVQTASGPVSPVAFSAEILKVLKAQAEQTLGDELVGA